MLKDIPQTLACPICKSQIHFTVSGLLHGECFTCPGCLAVMSLSTESRQALQSVADAFDGIRQHQTFTENSLPSAPQQFTGLPLEELIGSSLNAKEKADAALAIYISSFLKEHGLEVSPDTALIEMDIELPQSDASDADGTTEDNNPSTTFNIPLSAVIPFDSLGTEIQLLSK